MRLLIFALGLANVMGFLLWSSGSLMAQSRDALKATPNESLSFREASPGRGPASVVETDAPSVKVKPAYDPEVNNQQTEGVFCITCLYGTELRSENLVLLSEKIKQAAIANSKSSGK